MFRDRHDAGRRLGRVLGHLRAPQPLVLGLPRGGVPVAYEVALALDAPLDVLVVRKIGAPMQPEFAIGAIAPGVTLVDWDLVEQLLIPPEAVERIVAAETRELERRERIYRQGRPPLDVRGRTVILVDDGLATGATATAAVRALRGMGAGRVVVAVPLGARDSVEALRQAADDVVCLETPSPFVAVGLGYEDFSPTSDAEVLQCLAAADQRMAGGRDGTAAAPPSAP